MPYLLYFLISVRSCRIHQRPIQFCQCSTTEPPSSNSKYAVSASLKKMASSSTLGESKPNSILMKMREKAASEKNIEHALAAPPTKPTGHVKHISCTSLSSTNTENQVSQIQTSSRPTPVQLPTALKSILDPANKPTVSEPTKPSPKKQEEKPLSPMQTYEMSDREEDSDSDSESDGDENQRPKKAVSEGFPCLALATERLNMTQFNLFRSQSGLKRQIYFVRWKDNIPMAPFASILTKSSERCSHATWKKSLTRRSLGIKKGQVLATGPRIM